MSADRIPSMVPAKSLIGSHGHSHRSQWIPFVLFIVILLPGCSSKPITKAMVQRVSLGMSQEAVEGILGPGKPVDDSEVHNLLQPPSDADNAAATTAIKLDFSDIRGLRWGSASKGVTVIFKNDRVFRVFTEGIK